MFYIHHTTCISHRQTFEEINIDTAEPPAGNKLNAREPSYQNIPPGVLRRMGKAVRMSVGAAMPLVYEKTAPDAFIIGTANGGMEDCIKFLNQIISYEEGMLTPGNFVQSTPNAIASQISQLTRNTAYNITHVHRGLAFENAVIDAVMQITERPANRILVGGVDEISSYNFNIDYLDGWYRQELSEREDLYAPGKTGTIAGEGAAMFLVSGIPENAVARLRGVATMHTANEDAVATGLRDFMEKHLVEGEKIDLFLSGENGDSRLLKYYTACEEQLKEDVAIARFKHMSGEYATASAFAVWLACHILEEQSVPDHLLKNTGTPENISNILICNNFKGAQHSFILLSR